LVGVFIVQPNAEGKHLRQVSCRPVRFVKKKFGKLQEILKDQKAKNFFAANPAKRSGEMSFFLAKIMRIGKAENTYTGTNLSDLNNRWFVKNAAQKMNEF